MNFKILFILAILVIFTTIGLSKFKYNLFGQKPVKIGILHSTTGTMANMEQGLVDTALMAIDQINSSLFKQLYGGIEPIIKDCKSDPKLYASAAQDLITEHGVVAIFGCSNRESRLAVKEIVESHDNLLFYPFHYEGLEESQNIVYLGALPNQRILPAINWCLDNIGKKIFFITSDSVEDLAMYELIKNYINSLNGQIIDQIIIKSQDISSMAKQAITQIQKSKPEIILHNIKDIEFNKTLFKEIQNTDIRDIPFFSLSLDNFAMQEIGLPLVQGKYIATNYVQNILSDINFDFVKKYKIKFGSKESISDAMEAVYVGLNIWAQACIKTGTTESSIIKDTIIKESFNAPEGPVSVDGNHHLWKIARIGKFRLDSTINIIWTSLDVIEPTPYPGYLTKPQWLNLIKQIGRPESLTHKNVSNTRAIRSKKGTS